MFNFNSSGNESGGSDSQQNDFFSFLNPVNWPRFGEPPAGHDPFSQPHAQAYQHSQRQQRDQYQMPAGSYDGGHALPSDATDMDWTSTSGYHNGFPHDVAHPVAGTPHEHIGLDHFGSFHGGHGDESSSGGVGRLVAQFENRDINPPLPPRPGHQQQPVSPMVHSPQGSASYGAFHPSSFGSVSVSNHTATHSPHSPQIATQFGSFNSVDATMHNQMPSPVASVAETGFGSFGNHSRVASPLVSSPPSTATFGGFHDSRVSTPTAGPSSQSYGSLNNLMAGEASTNSAQENQGVSSPNYEASNAAVPGTPGFEIWRPPGSDPSATTPKPIPAQTTNVPPTSATNYFRPPVPPKPAFASNNQFILEFNPNAKAKAKAPAKPPRPRAPSTASISVFPPDIKQEPRTTPIPETPGASSTTGTLDTRRSSVSLRTAGSARPSREQVPAEAWESYKTTIRTLYLEERKPLKEVMAVMAEKYGFQATPKMYKTRFSSWGFVKNNTEDEVKRLLSMKFQRDAEGKVSEFVRNGKIVNLGTYLKRKGVTEYDLVDFEKPADLPAHIRCRTPTPPLTPEYLRSPDLLRVQELVIGNVRKAFLQCRQIEVETETHISWPSMMIWGAGSSDLLLEANFYFEAMDADQGGHSLMRAFQVLEGDLLKLSPQGINEVLLGMVRRDPGMMTALCKYLSAYCSTNSDRSHPLRQIFTCLYEVQQKHGATTLSDLLWATLPTITEELEAIYSRRHPYVARAWVDLAEFYNHPPADRYEKLVGDLRAVHRQVEQCQGATSPDALALRYALAQWHFAAGSQSSIARQSAIELWDTLRSGGLVFPVRDSRANAYCFHCPVKVDPWSKRCRRRYDSLVALLELHAGVKVMPYFEEDFHTAEHAPNSHEAWAAAMGQPKPDQPPGSQDPWAAAMSHQAGSSGWGLI